MTARLLAALEAAGFDAAEVFVKSGRSQSVALGGEVEGACAARERGWAVRAGSAGRALFVTGSGEPPESPSGWPEPVAGTLRLPPPRPVPAWRSPADLDAPLLGEAEGFELLNTVTRRLQDQLPGSRLLRGALEDGGSESRVTSSRGVDRPWRGRGSTILLEAGMETADGWAGAVLEDWAPAARALVPDRLAARLADRLAVESAAPLAGLERGDVVLAPPAAARLLAGLTPLFVGREAETHWRAYRDRSGRLGSEAVRVVDDGRAAIGLPAPVDGEGMPTRRVVLVEAGRPRQPLLAWEQAEPPSTLASGCTRRPGWRDLPARGPTHLYLQGDAELSPASVLGAVQRGFYLFEAFAGGRVDLAADRFALPVTGFALRDGRVDRAFRRAWLHGAISAFLHGVAAAARDTRLFPLDGMIGAPTLRVGGLELTGWDGAGAVP